MTGQSSQSRAPAAGPYAPSTPPSPPLGMRVPGALVPSCQPGLPGADLARQEGMKAEEREAEQQATGPSHTPLATPAPSAHGKLMALH